MGPIPAHFDYERVAIFSGLAGYRRFVTGEHVPVTELDPDDDDYRPEIVEGLCLVMLWDDFYYPYYEKDPKYVHNLVSKTFLGQCANGLLHRIQETNVSEYLANIQRMSISDVKSVPISRLREATCTRDRQLGQYFDPIPDAYMTIYRAGGYAGLLNRAWCRHVACGADFVHVIDDTIVFWMRTDGADVEWIEFFPIALDRTGTREEFERSIVILPKGLYFDV